MSVMEQPCNKSSNTRKVFKYYLQQGHALPGVLDRDLLVEEGPTIPKVRSKTLTFCWLKDLNISVISVAWTCAFRLH